METTSDVLRAIGDQPARTVRVATLGALVDYYGTEALEGAVDLAGGADRLRETARSRQ